MDNPYPICENCIFVDVPLDKDPCQECNRAFLAQRIKPNFVRKRKPKTNADRIRSMSDEELAYYMMRTTKCPCEARASGCCRSDITCQKAWLDWLREEVKE